MRRLMAVVLVLMAVACTGASLDAPGTTDLTTTTSTATTSTLPPVVECPGDGDFAEGANIAAIDGSGSDSGTLGRISWAESDRCETFTLIFETTEGAPATTVPDISVRHLGTFQVIRIEMDVASTIITDQLVETDLVDRLYVVRGLDGRMFVDLHLGSPAAARVATHSSPARIDVDLRPGLVPFEGISTVDDRVVVVSPGAGAEVSPQVPIIGYSRTFEANVLVRATQDGAVVAETLTTVADHVDTWGEFDTEMALPTGRVSMFVGESSPEDGDLGGVTIELTVSSNPRSR